MTTLETFYTKKGSKKTPNVVFSFQKITEEYIKDTPSVVVPQQKSDLVSNVM